MASYFACQHCGISLNTLKGYVNHQTLHRHEANAQYPCCFSDCKQHFRTFSAFKAHVYRKHRTPTSQIPYMDVPLKCGTSDCQIQCTQIKDLLGHLKSHLLKNEMVKCPFSNCGKMFKVRSSFTAHISRAHKKDKELSIALTSSAQPMTSTQEVCEDESTVNFEVYPDNIPGNTEIRTLYTKNLCMFFMKLQAKCLIPSSTVQLIIGDE